MAQPTDVDSQIDATIQDIIKNVSLIKKNYESSRSFINQNANQHRANMIMQDVEAINNREHGSSKVKLESLLRLLVNEYNSQISKDSLVFSNINLAQETILNKNPNDHHYKRFIGLTLKAAIDSIDSSNLNIKIPINITANDIKKITSPNTKEYAHFKETTKPDPIQKSSKTNDDPQMKKARELLMEMSFLKEEYAAAGHKTHKKDFENLIEKLRNITTSNSGGKDVYKESVNAILAAFAKEFQHKTAGKFFFNKTNDSTFISKINSQSKDHQYTRMLANVVRVLDQNGAFYKNEVNNHSRRIAHDVDVSPSEHLTKIDKIANDAGKKSEITLKR